MARISDGSTLAQINLWKNNLTTLPRDIFRDNRQLAIVDIRDNKLTSLPDGIFANQRLWELRINGNQLTDLPTDIENMTTLRFLYIANNPIETQNYWSVHTLVSKNSHVTIDVTLPPPAPLFGHTQQVQDTIANALGKKHKDVTLEDLAGITDLFLNDTSITSLKSIDFKGLVNLKGLYLERNGLTSLPLDHVRPKSEGGTNDIDNRALLCQPCNSKKSDKMSLTSLRRQNKKEGYEQAGTPVDLKAAAEWTRTYLIKAIEETPQQRSLFN